MKTSHTPGIWTVKPWVSKDEDGAIENTGLQVVAVSGTTETGIFSSCDESDEGCEEADLYLIAAAPDLLEALIKALTLLEEYEVKIDSEWGSGRTLQQIDDAGRLPEEIVDARKAIAKATGEANEKVEVPTTAQ